MPVEKVRVISPLPYMNFILLCGGQRICYGVVEIVIMMKICQNRIDVAIARINSKLFLNEIYRHNSNGYTKSRLHATTFC